LIRKKGREDEAERKARRYAFFTEEGGKGEERRGGTCSAGRGREVKDEWSSGMFLLIFTFTFGISRLRENEMKEKKKKGRGRGERGT